MRRRLHSAGANVTASLKPAEVDELAALIAPWARRSVSGWPVMHSSLVMPNRSKAGASRTTSNTGDIVGEQRLWDLY